MIEYIRNKFLIATTTKEIGKLIKLIMIERDVAKEILIPGERTERLNLNKEKKICENPKEIKQIYLDSTKLFFEMNNKITNMLNPGINITSVDDQFKEFCEKDQHLININKKYNL